MSELVAPLLVAGLIGLALAARRYLQSSLASPITWCAVTGVVAYTAIKGLPLLGMLLVAWLDVRVAPDTVSAAPAEAPTTPVRVQVYGGPVLLGERRVTLGDASPRAVAPEPVVEMGREPAPAARAPEQPSTLDQGEQTARVALPESAPIRAEDVGAGLASESISADALDDSASFPLEGANPPEQPDGAPSETSTASAPAGAGVRSGPERARQAPTPQVGTRRPELESPEGEVALRARASRLAVDEVCAAADLLASGRADRTVALERVLRQRCARAPR